MLKRMVPEYQPESNGDPPRVAPTATVEAPPPVAGEEEVAVRGLAAVEQPAK